MKAKHTPGPWFPFANGQCVGGPVGPIGNPSGADTAGVAHCGMGLRTGAEVTANVRLIAAAPAMKAELLTVLEAVKTGAPEPIGYGDIGKPAFQHGWNAAMEHVYARMVLAIELAATEAS